MAYVVPTTEPTQIHAGDRIRWKVSIPNHSATAWTLKYYLKLRNSPSGPITITATNNAGSHEVDVTAATSGNWQAGKYDWVSYVENASDATERYQADSGVIEVLPNFAGILTPYDGRSVARRILDAHLEAYEARAGRPEQSYSISAAGRSFTYKTDAEMLAAIEKWEDRVAAEEGTRRKNVLVRFGPTA